MKVGSKIRYIRLLHQKERKEIAEFLKLSLSQYSNIENDVSNIDDEKLDQLAEFYNTSKENMLNIDPEKVVHQINNDSSVGIGINLGTVYQQNSELISKLIENQNLLFGLLNDFSNQKKG